MNYSDKLKVYWFTPQRTGTRSTLNFLKVLDFKILEHRFILDKSKLDYFLISNVRNPYSRLVSVFMLDSAYMNNFNYPFEKWIYNLVDTPSSFVGFQINYHEYIWGNQKKFDKLIRLENIVDDIKSLDFIDFTDKKIETAFNDNIRTNIWSNEFENLSNKPRQNWKTFWNEELAELAYNKLKFQFELFGYEKNSWKNGTP